MVKVLKLSNLNSCSEKARRRGGGDDDATSSSLTYGTNVVFAGGAARGLRKFMGVKNNEDLGGYNDDYTQGGGSGTNGEPGVTEYEIAGDAEDFKSAIAELKSWRLARAKGGWNPGGKEEGTVLRIREGTKGGVGGGNRPGTAPARGGWGGQRGCGVSVSVCVTPHTTSKVPRSLLCNNNFMSPPSPSRRNKRDALDTPSTNTVGGFTPRRLDSRGEGR